MLLFFRVEHRRLEPHLPFRGWNVLWTNQVVIQVDLPDQGLFADPSDFRDTSAEGDYPSIVSPRHPVRQNGQPVPNVRRERQVISFYDVRQGGLTSAGIRAEFGPTLRGSSEHRSRWT